MYDSEGDADIGGSDNGSDNASGSEDEDPEVEVENKYFEAKELAEEDPREGLTAFEEVLDLASKLKKKDDEEKNWGFKALKRIIKLNHQLKKHDKVKEKYQRMLKDFSAVLVSQEKALNNLLDAIAESPHIKDLYDLTLESFEKNGNKKACLRLELRLTKVLAQKKDFVTLEKKLRKMHAECQTPDGRDDPSKGNQLMEIYAMEISMHSARANYRKLKELYEKALQIKGLCNPKISGIIHECGGKMHMRERNWVNANTDFFEAFKNYDDAGARSDSVKCLKYLVLANMLSGSKINPFDEQRAKSYQNNKDIRAMIDLIDAYQRHVIKAFEKVLKENKEAILGDEFIADYIQDLMKSLRSEVLLELIQPYTNISLPFISKELNITPKEVEDLLVELILDNKIRGHIDQVNQMLLLSATKSSSYWKYRSIQKWTDNLTSLEKTILGRVN
eukprot:TRINITY_DN1913_c0_g1_i1.p1 TRINITY_DN1913_c0_g1~~TRINITY_DN1913_c0_g1_i1.p1  ORF type:complete len:464 (-),score=167.38 TRINITY_DN1913_c0_g1_i1:147-1487(-)